MEQSVRNSVISNGDFLLVSCLVDILEGGIFHPMVFFKSIKCKFLLLICIFFAVFDTMTLC